jgi:hypothetical protein
MQPAARVQGQTISAAALAKGKKEYVSKCFNSISSHIGAKSLLWALLSVADPQIRSAPWYRHARAEVLDITVFDSIARGKNPHRHRFRAGSSGRFSFRRGRNL